MKKILGVVLAVCALALAIVMFFHARGQRAKSEPSLPPAIAAELFQVFTNETPPQSNRPAGLRSFTKRLADMTEEEKAKLGNDFTNRYKPVVEKWLEAYKGHVPFRSEDFTLDKFHSKFGDYSYTFMIGDITFAIQDSPRGLKVSYLMTRGGARKLNSLPADGTAPDLSVPITRDEVIRMVKADSGVEFKPNEVLIKPTGAACSLMGGAFVDLLPAGLDPNNGLNYKISMVFGPDGNLVNYNRDPFF